MQAKSLYVILHGRKTCLKRVHLPPISYKFDYDSLLKLFVEAPMVSAKKPQILCDSKLENL